MLPRRPPYVASGREVEMKRLMEVASQGGTLLLEGATGVGKTSLALECAHRLPRALWVSAWPALSQEQLEKRLGWSDWDNLNQQRLCLFLDHGEHLEGCSQLLALASHQLNRGALIVIADRRLRLPPSARVERVLVEGPPRCPELPAECQLLTLRPRGLPQEVLREPTWLAYLEERFLIRRDQNWISMHPSLARAGSQELHSQVADLLADLQVSPTLVEERIWHLIAAARIQEGVSLLQEHGGKLLQAGSFQAVLDICQELLQQDPRLALAHFLRAEAHSGQGRLELARADYRNADRWGDSRMQLRSQAALSHLELDTGRWKQAEESARAALQLAERLGGGQPATIKALNAQSRLCNLRGQAQQAEKLARQALRLSQELKNPKGEAYSFFILAQALAELKDWDGCLQQALNALHLARQQGETRLTLLARCWAGGALLQAGSLEQALEWLQATWKESREFSDCKMQILSDLLMAQALAAVNQASRALEHLTLAESEARRAGYPLLTLRQLLLRQSLEDQPEWGRRARQLADSLGLSLAEGPVQEVWTQGSCRPWPREALENLRQASLDYDLFMDLERGQVRERNQGEVALVSKKIPLALLLLLMRNPGLPQPVESLFAAIWPHPYEGESSAAQVRKNINTLRKLLETDRSRPRYILASTSGGYCFNQAASYCVIHPPTA